MPVSCVRVRVHVCLCVFVKGAEVLVASVLQQLTALGLAEYDNRVAEVLLDHGYEDIVPLRDLVQYLRDAGIPAARALAIKNVVATPQPVSACLCVQLSLSLV